MDRIDVEQLVDEVQAAIEPLPEYSSFVGPDADQDDRGRISIRHNIEVFLNWAGNDGGPSEDELQKLRDLLGVRASEGRPIRDGLIVYRRAMRAAWQAVLAQADDREKVALGGAFEIPLEWLDLVSDEYEAAYAAEQDARVSAHERRSRWLMESIITGRDAEGDARQLAEGLGFQLAKEYLPFVATIPGGTAAAHLRLAADLRAGEMLARSEAILVSGLSHRVPDIESLPPRLVVAVGSATTGADAARQLTDLGVAVELAARAGRRGLVDPGEYAVQVMVRRTPEQVRQLEALYFDPLTAARREDLVLTLRTLAATGFDRSAAAERLGIHRNTMSQRLERIELLSGFDLADPSVRGGIWLAHVASGQHEPASDA